MLLLNVVFWSWPPTQSGWKSSGNWTAMVAELYVTLWQRQTPTIFFNPSPSNNQDKSLRLWRRLFSGLNLGVTMHISLIFIRISSLMLYVVDNWESLLKMNKLAAPKYCKSVPDKIFILDLYSERKGLLDQKRERYSYCYMVD